MAKRRGRKSDAIRQVLAEHPEATVKEIQAALAAKRVKASVALISKLKSGNRQRRNSQRNGKPSPDFARLLLAKQFIREAGGIESAKEALQQLAKLLD
ncbi:MAG: hypothetical protein K2Y37_19120 [Pirellulales bacterium]|nr:hypothetical protein [Pirellulales bacterium]